MAGGLGHNPAQEAGQRPAQPQDLLHDDEEGDDAEDIDQQDAGIEAVIAETERLGEDIRQELVAEPVLRARLDVGCRPEADLLERAEVHERMILVEFPERRLAGGNDVAQASAPSQQ